MPLMKGKSPKSFEHNLKAEMAAGKPQKQALAIAYATKRRAEHKANGGMINEKLHPHHEPMMDHESIAEAVLRRRKMAMGGEVEPESETLFEEQHAGDDFLDADMAPVDYSGKTYPDADGTEHEIEMEDPREKRRKMLSGIMAGLKSKHYGYEE